MVRARSKPEVGGEEVGRESHGKSFAIIKDGEIFSMPDMWCQACHASLLGVRHRGDCKETARRKKAIQQLVDAGDQSERLLRRYQKLIVGGSPVYKEVSACIAQLKRHIKAISKLEG